MEKRLIIICWALYLGPFTLLGLSSVKAGWVFFGSCFSVLRSQGDDAFLQIFGGPLMRCCQVRETRNGEASFKVHGRFCLLGCLHSNSFLSLRMPRQALNMVFGSCSRLA